MTDPNLRKGDYFEEVVPIDQEDDYNLGPSYSEQISQNVTTATSDESSSTLKDSTLRKGKWTTEEENYANKIINLFNRGLLPIAAGTTLRSYLSDKLHCDPMRITKKFAGASCIGKQIFQPTPSSEVVYYGELDDLQRLERLFLSRIGSGGGSGSNLSGLLHANEEDKSSPMTDTARYASPAFDSRSPGDRTVTWDSEIGEERKTSSTYGLRRSSSSSRAKLLAFKRVVSAPDLSRPGQFEIDFPHKRIADESAEAGGGGAGKVVGGGGAAVTGAATTVGETVENVQRKPRSQSMMDLNDFEKYISDDTAAGDLLMSFHCSAVDSEVSPIRIAEPLKKRQFIHSGSFGFPFSTGSGSGSSSGPQLTGPATVPSFSAFGIAPFFSSLPSMSMSLSMPSTSSFFGIPTAAPPAPPPAADTLSSSSSSFFGIPIAPPPTVTPAPAEVPAATEPVRSSTFFGIPIASPQPAPTAPPPPPAASDTTDHYYPLSSSSFFGIPTAPPPAPPEPPASAADRVTSDDADCSPDAPHTAAAVVTHP